MFKPVLSKYIFLAKIKWLNDIFVAKWCACLHSEHSIYNTCQESAFGGVLLETEYIILMFLYNPLGEYTTQSNMACGFHFFGRK